MANAVKSAKGRVLLVDDDLSVRRGVAALLSAANYAVSVFESGDDFLARQAETELNDAAMLLDIYMPGIKGLDLQAELSRAGVDVPVIVMTAHGDVPMAVRAMRQGAVDFLEKPFTAEELINALEKAFAQLSLVHNAKNDDQDSIRRSLDKLSPRERDVLRGMMEGETNKEIARRLEVSPRTVEVHRRNIMTKMNADSFAALIRMVVTISPSV